jgi:hypothetical protein
MECTDLELNLVKKQMSGEYNDIQFNYWVVYYNLDKKRLEEIKDDIYSMEPMVRACKFLLAVIMVHFLFCLIYSIFYHIGQL